MSVILNLLKLMKLSANQPIVDPSTGYPTAAFQRLQNDQAANEERIVNALVDQTNNITSALDQAGIATTAANTAATNASTALATAGSVARELSIVASFPDADILTAAIDTANPTTAIISIASHIRHYGDGSSVTVGAGSIMGQPLSTTRYIYYIDPARSGGAVSYQVTANMAAAAQRGDRHTIGVITTPPTGGAPNTGVTAPAPGIPSLP